MSVLATFTVAAFVFTAAVGVYLLPSLIGLIRHVPSIGSIFVINLLLGWTFIAWAVCLAMAVRTVPRPPVQLISARSYYEPPAARPGGPGGGELP